MKGKLKVKQDTVNFMPAFFTPTNSMITAPDSEYYDVTKLTLVYETDMEKLAEYIPPELELTSNRLAIVKIENGSIQCFGGRRYDLLCVVASVRYQTEKETVDGSYSLAMWENMFEPIMFGREAFGVPKLMADLDPITKVDHNYFTNASINCSTFLKVKATLTNKMSEQEIAKVNETPIERAINLRHLPQPSGRGVSYEDIALYQTRNHYTDGITGTGSFEWIVPDPHENPSQEHIIHCLAELPCHKILSASMMHKSFSNIEWLNGRILQVLHP